MERAAVFGRAEDLRSAVSGPGSDAGSEPGLERGAMRDGSGAGLPCTRQPSTSGPKRCVSKVAPLLCTRIGYNAPLGLTG
jgi:hypothetical protein